MDIDKINYRKLSKEEKIEIVQKELERIIAKKELYDFMYEQHGEDTYEDVFRDGECNRLHLLIQGIKYTLCTLKEESEEEESEEEEPTEQDK